ncbi:hypothetical protein [Aureivirga sp. CE67]|uniref:hypothetical protein n=1 Tax=Aureivirga sp. CE67 TaxID=1788983 RepID=UPI0018C912C3|nr:hypothetical protein [Aureivirga sp. CE67]
MERIKNIEIGQGLGLIKFGFLKNEIKLLLGEPSNVDLEMHSEDGGDASETWDYDNIGVSFTFDEEEDWKLETITVFSDFFQLKKRILIGKSKEEVAKIIAQLELGEIEYEDYSEDESLKRELFDLTNGNMMFWFTNDVLTEIQFGVLWRDEEVPLWPTIN